MSRLSNNSFSMHNSNSFRINFFTKTVLLAGIIGTTIFTTSFASLENGISVYASQVAIPSSSNIYLDTQKLNFEAYTINNTTYLKLRDVAQALNSTDKQFDVTWDNEKSAINLVSNTPYNSIGGELSYNNLENLDNQDNQDNQVDITKTTSFLYKDDVLINIDSYMINQNTYFKVRDLGDLLGFEVEYDETTKDIILNL